MIRGLDGRAEVGIHLVGIMLAFSIVHVACVDAGTRDQVDDVHQSLFSCLGYPCNDGNFLEVGTRFEQELGWILWVVGGNESQIVLAHHVGSWFTIRQHELFKNLIWQRCQIPAGGGWGGSGGCLVCIGNVSIKDVEAGMAHIDAGLIVVFGKGMFRCDGEDLLARVR